MQKFILYTTGLTCLIFNLFLIYLQFDELNLSDEKFLDLKRCPFCFGYSLCNDLQFKSTFYTKFDIELADEYNFSKTYFLQYLFNIKNVFFAIERFSGKKLVIKKLAHYSELNRFDTDEIECADKTLGHKPCIKNLINKNRSLMEKKLDFKTLKNVSIFLDIEIGQCFTERIVDLIYKSYLEYNNNDRLNTKSYYVDNIILLTILKINPEPLILQVWYIY